jgi:CBS domain-containing protein
MNRVEDILSHKKYEPVTIAPGEKVIEALRIMSEKNIGSIIVMEEGAYKGIVTERDYSRKIVLKGKSSNETTVAEIMSTDLPHVKPNDTIERCMELMSDKNIRYLPVFENNNLTGIVSISDVVKETILAQQDTINHLESYIHSNT